MDTLREMKQELGDEAILCFMIGADAFMKLAEWHSWRELFSLCHFIVAARPGHPLLEATDTLPRELKHECQDRWVSRADDLARASSGLVFMAPTTLLDISATNIRACISVKKKRSLPAARRDPRLYLNEPALSGRPMTLTKLVKTIVAALEEIKARDIEVLDVSKMTDLCDRMIIASGDSSRQTKAIANNVSEKVKAGGGTVYGIEGEQVVSGFWWTWGMCWYMSCSPQCGRITIWKNYGRRQGKSVERPRPAPPQAEKRVGTSQPGGVC